MSADPHYPDPAERADLNERDLAIATLVGRYVERREERRQPQVHDLLAAAGEFGDDAAEQLRTILGLYEALLAEEAQP